jgi:hypothetical protein
VSNEKRCEKSLMTTAAALKVEPVHSSEVGRVILTKASQTSVRMA